METDVTLMDIGYNVTSVAVAYTQSGSPNVLYGNEVVRYENGVVVARYIEPHGGGAQILPANYTLVPFPAGTNPPDVLVDVNTFSARVEYLAVAPHTPVYSILTLNSAGLPVRTYYNYQSLAALPAAPVGTYIPEPPAGTAAAQDDYEFVGPEYYCNSGSQTLSRTTVYKNGAATSVIWQTINGTVVPAPGTAGGAPLISLTIGACEIAQPASATVRTGIAQLNGQGTWQAPANTKLHSVSLAVRGSATSVVTVTTSNGTVPISYGACMSWSDLDANGIQVASTAGARVLITYGYSTTA
jgi:hypothetical protein